MSTEKQTAPAIDGITRFKLIADLQREMHADGCTDARQVEILAEIRKLKASEKKKRPGARRAKETDQYMTILGGYVLDMKQHGKLVGHRGSDGEIIKR